MTASPPLSLPENVKYDVTPNDRPSSTEFTIEAAPKPPGVGLHTLEIEARLVLDLSSDFDSGRTPNDLLRLDIESHTLVELGVRFIHALHDVLRVFSGGRLSDIPYATTPSKSLILYEALDLDYVTDSPIRVTTAATYRITLDFGPNDSSAEILRAYLASHTYSQLGTLYASSAHELLAVHDST